MMIVREGSCIEARFDDPLRNQRFFVYDEAAAAAVAATIVAAVAEEREASATIADNDHVRGPDDDPAPRIAENIRARGK